MESNRTPSSGGFTFAEHPGRAAPEARIIWHVDLDPGTLDVIATPIDRSNPDAIAFDRLLPWLAIAKGRRGAEHVALSDGLHRIRLDVVAGSVAGAEPVLLRYRLKGIARAGPQILPLRRFLDLCRHGRFARSLFPPDRRVDRWLTVLRVHDALAAGASQREIAEALFGPCIGRAADDDRSDSLRSRVRRLVREARRMSGGGWRSLMRRERA